MIPTAHRGVATRRCFAVLAAAALLVLGSTAGWGQYPPTYSPYGPPPGGYGIGAYGGGYSPPAPYGGTLQGGLGYGQPLQSTVQGAPFVNAPAPYGGGSPYGGIPATLSAGDSTQAFNSGDPLYPYDSKSSWVHGYFQEIPAYGGHHYYRPYNYRHVLSQSQVAAGWGMSPVLPYSQQFFRRYEEQAAVSRILRGRDEYETARRRSIDAQDASAAREGSRGWIHPAGGMQGSRPPARPSSRVSDDVAADETDLDAAREYDLEQEILERERELRRLRDARRRPLQR
jgi:hypothetical protein